VPALQAQSPEFKSHISFHKKGENKTLEEEIQVGKQDSEKLVN
jgi:hypothetical protein